MHPKVRRYPLTCAKCGTGFERTESRMRASRTGSFFCSPVCGKAARTIAAGTLSRSCLTCGKAFAVKPHEAARVYCGCRCANTRKAQQEQSCTNCGRAFTVAEHAAGRPYCSRACYSEFKSRKPRDCAQCDVTYQPNSATQRFCTPTCQQVASRKTVTLTCMHCGGSFSIYRAGASRRAHCSKRCQFLSLTRSGQEGTAVAMVAAILGEQPVRQKCFPWLVSDLGKSLRLDAYFPQRNMAVEFDGPQHRRYIPFIHGTPAGLARIQALDSRKTLLLATHGIPLLRITDGEPMEEAHIRRRVAECLHDASLAS